MEIKNGEFPREDMLQALVEAALINEEVISKAAKTLQSATEILQQHTRILPERIAANVNREMVAAADDAANRISSKFKDANDTAERARVGYERAVRFSTRRVVLIGLVCFGIGCLGMIVGLFFTAKFILPEPDIIQRAREAERVVKLLTSKGGNSILTMCLENNVEKLCIRTDESRGSFLGPQRETYRIIYGY